MAKYTIIVCYRDNEFLLVYNPERGWEFPGGKIKENETPQKAAQREFKEETAYRPRSLKIIEKDREKSIFKAELGERTKQKSEYPIAFFRKLPENLSFPQKEYKKIIEKTKQRSKQNP
ncbi:NUDIX domain-containing protein [Methanonatronarchaeum sp. AMET6-2]|uniref:NUDIX domain-containing protein n=1 Tax=Methanonatronarchaeum sp. AMET6-2 TaxID=2933293 RepID=UPI0011FDB665|nr:NUDIX domain-containing protein [Methanonatronarchaeum sp. AMET6-2]RZN63222.1 MAG: NUDIX domain-containing protein [Methanonatronarchaeia archaeon]UOY10518.1 NUDIX domain-containing protein [Methanonatronarchaeum sp. AMET6-2]